MASFGSGFVGGLGSGLALGRVVRDAWDDSRVSDAAGAKLEESDFTPEPAEEKRAPERTEQEVFDELAKVDMNAPAVEAAPAAEPAPSKKSWAIGEGKHRKTWDSKPTDEDVRQWRYDTIMATAGAKHADAYRAREQANDATKRATELDTMKLAHARLGNEDALEMRAVQAGQDTGANLSEAIQANGGTVDSYMAAKTGDTPLSKEQQDTIRAASGLAMDPTSQYRMTLRQAAIAGRTNPDKAAILTRAAHEQAAGKFRFALDSGDTKTMKAIYNVFPNGHTVADIAMDGDKVTITDTQGKSIVKTKRELDLMAMSFGNPDKADSAEAADARVAQNDAFRKQQMELKQQEVDIHKARADAYAAKVANGGGSGSADERKDANEIFKEVSSFLKGEDGKPDAERLAPTVAVANALYRSGKASSFGEAGMLAIRQLENAEFSPERALARAAGDVAKIKKEHNVTGGMNPTGNSWATVIEKLTGKDVPEEQFVRDLAQRYQNNGKSLASSLGAQPTAAGSPYPEGKELVGKDGNRYVVRNGKPVPVGGATQGAPAPAARPAPQATQGPAQPQPAATQAATPARRADPLADLAGKGAEYVRNKRAQIAKEMEGWQRKGDPNAKKLIAELQTKLDRIDQGDY